MCVFDNLARGYLIPPGPPMYISAKTEILIFAFVIQVCEESCLRKLGKSVVASCDLEKGRVIRMEDLKVKVSPKSELKYNFFTLHHTRVIGMGGVLKGYPHP